MVPLGGIIYDPINSHSVYPFMNLHRVVSPNFIGGMRMVSEMLRPSVVRFMDDMLRDKRAAYRIEEVTIGAGSPLEGWS